MMRSACSTRAFAWVLLFFLVFAAATATAWEQRSWSRTIYYHSAFEADAEGEGRVRITAVDSYQLFFNGTLIGSDDDWTTVEAYPVQVKKRANEILVAVTHSGTVDGSGLIVEVEAGNFRSFTRPGNQTDAWRWSSDDPEEVDWDKAPLVQNGILDMRKIRDLSNLNLLALPVAGFPGEVALGDPQEGIVLSRIRGRNLALDKPSNHTEANDGVLTSVWNAGVNSLNKFVSIDLRDIRRVSSVRVITGAPRGKETYRNNALRGYSIQVSDDQFRWSEVGVLHNITDYEETTLQFQSVLTRYVRLVIAEIDGISAPKVAEIEVYGQGYSPRGMFVSDPLDLGQDGPKNIGQITWEAEISEKTALTLQFRTSDDGSTWSAWTREYDASGILIEAPEPARFLQYRAHLSTRQEGITPRFRGITVDFSTDDIPAAAARGYISPTAVEMGEETAFTYALDLDVSPQNTGVERVILQVPGPAVLDETTPVEGAGGSAVNLDQVAMTSRGWEIPFDPPLEQDAQLIFHFRTTQYAISHEFRTHLLGPDSDNPLNAVENTEGGASWRTTAAQVLDEVLLEVGASPPVFTPNGDSRNDFTIIEFSLAKVAEVQVDIGIFRLDGSLVRTLHAERLSAGNYTRFSNASQPASSLGYWDGRDAHGNFVPPGIYIYQVKVRSDEEQRQRLGSVGVVY